MSGAVTRATSWEGAFWVLLSMARVTDPPRWLVSRIVAKLDVDCRFILAVEGVDLGREQFGPFHYEHGNYGHMSWAQAREAARRLIDLGVVEIDQGGRFAWTLLGERALELIPIQDAVLPHLRGEPGLPGTKTQERLLLGAMQGAEL